MTQDFQTALDAYVERLNHMMRAHFRENYPNLYHADQVPVIEADTGGQKYTRIVNINGSNRSVHSFVDNATGAILKADGWKRPSTKTAARGSIYDLDAGGFTVYGAASLR